MRGILVGCLLLAVLAAACGDKADTTSGPAGPSSPTVSSVTITGTLTISNVGLTTQLTATAHFAKGTSQDVTTQATWSSGDAGVATVSPTGLVTSTGTGSATITATYSNVSGSTHVTVTRPPSYVLGGLVTESVPTTSTLLPGVRIEFTDASNNGRFATTDGTGHYQISEIPGGTYNVRATLSGYVDATKQVAVNANTTLDFALVPAPKTLWTSFFGQISPGDAACDGTVQPCEVFSLPPIHNTGPLIATLVPQISTDAVLDLQLYNADTRQLIASKSATGQVLVETTIPVPGNYQMRVVALSISQSVPVRVNVTSYPN